MKAVQRTLLTVVVGILASSTLLAQARGRMWGTVVDENGTPLVGVKITVVDNDLEKEIAQRETKKGGRYSVALVDATKVYTYRFELEGYQTHEETLKIPVQSNTRKDLTLYSWAYLRNNQPAKSGDAQRGPVAIPGDPVATAYNQGVAAMEEENYEEAEAKFSRAVELDPKLQVGHSALARLYLRLEKYDLAVQHAEQALEFNSEDEAALSVRYQAYDALGNKEKAQEAYETLATLTAPAVAAYNVGVDAFQAGNYEVARDRFAESVTIDSKLLPGFIALARTHFQLKEYDATIQVAEQVLAMEPDNVNALALRYDAYRQTDDEAGTRAALEALKAVAPERLTDSYYEKGVELFNANQMNEAQAAFLQVLEADPDHARSHYMLGLSYVNAGDNARAKEHLQRYLELDPDDVDAPTAREMLKFL